MTTSLSELLAVIARLNAEDSIEKLDNLLVDSCRFGLSANFCTREGHRLDVREGMADMALQYYDITGGLTNIMSGDEKVRVLKNKDDIRHRLFEGDLRKKYIQTLDTLSFYIRHMPKEEIRSTETVYEYFTNVLWSERAAKLAGDSKLRYDTKIPSFDSDNDRYVKFFTECCSRIKVYFACSGLSILFYSYSTYSVDRMYPVFKRFPGFHYADTYAFSSNLEKSTDAIPDTNWLTAIADVMFERIGGEAAAATTLGPEVVIHRYDGGVVFQAGPKPRLGDANMGDIPEAYRQVARFLRPLRFEDWDYPYLRVPDGVDKMQATRDWVSRFD